MLIKRMAGTLLLVFVTSIIYFVKYTKILRSFTCSSCEKTALLEDNVVADTVPLGSGDSRVNEMMDNQTVIPSAIKYKHFTSPKNQLERRFPKAMIIGMAKCGTGVLQRSLELNPLLISSGPDEVCFSTKMSMHHWTRTFTAELPLTLENQLTFTKCPQLLNHPDTISLLHEEFPTMRLIISVCDPVKQLVSRYTMHQEQGTETDLPPVCDSMFKQDGTVDSDYKYVKWSIFVEMLKPVFELFSLEQILIIDGENFIKDPVMELSRIEDFLKVPNIISRDMFLFRSSSDFFRGFTHLDRKTYHIPKGKGRKHPVCNESFYEKLHEFYEPYNKKLFSIISRNFTWNYNGR